MKKFTTEKGITLIALIITIIVMLILVGVTVNVALNGGLFDTTKEASKQKEKSIIYDQIVSAMNVRNNGTIDVKGTYEDAKEILTAQGKTVALVEPELEGEITDNTTSVIFTVTGKYGTFKYQITDTEIKIIEETGGGEIPPPPAEPQIELNVSSIEKEIEAGVPAEATLTATLSNAAAGEGLEWTVTPEDSGITISGEGNTKTITMTKEAEATIRVTYTGNSNIYKECSVKVTEKAKPQIELSDTTIEIEKQIGIDAETTLTATLSNAAAGEGLEWTVTPEDSGITISGEGNTKTITMTKEVEATIRVTYTGDTSIYKECSVKVTETLLPKGLTVGAEFQMDADGDEKNETWIVLYDGTASHLNENEIEVISKNTMKKLTLGKSDTEALAKATDIDKSGKVDDVEVAVYSYNNAIDRINNHCSSLIKIDNLGVRSVGSKPSNPNYRNTDKPVQLHSLDIWTDECKKVWDTYGILEEGTDTNSDDDYRQMNTLGIRASGDGESYWIASRSVSLDWYYEGTGGYVYFDVRYISGEQRNIASLWYVHHSEPLVVYKPEFAVRPVIKLQYP